jgi:hypothetical protein
MGWLAEGPAFCLQHSALPEPAFFLIPDPRIIRQETVIIKEIIIAMEFFLIRLISGIGR